MQDTNTGSAQAGGIGFGGALTLTFIVLKLTGVLTWSWWWVLSPVWIVGGLMLVLAGAGAAIFALLVVWDRHDHRRATRPRRAAGGAAPHEHGPRRRWGARPRPVYGNCPVHHSVHEMLAYGRMCDGWEPAPAEPEPRP